MEGLQRMERQGRQHLPTMFAILLQSYTTAGPESFRQVCCTEMLCMGLTIRLLDLPETGFKGGRTELLSYTPSAILLRIHGLSVAGHMQHCFICCTPTATLGC